MKKRWFTITAKASGVGEIFIFDMIDAYGVNARSFVKELKALGDVSALHIHINSPGGDVMEGQAIYSQLKSHPAKKTVFIDGWALSMASLIAMAGDVIVMPQNAMMMIHEPASVVAGTAEQMRRRANLTDKIGDTLVAIYTARTGLDEKEIRDLMAEETWLSADEAIEKGFADELAAPIAIAASFDLSKFKNAPIIPGQTDPGTEVGRQRGKAQEQAMKFKGKIPGPGGLREMEFETQAELDAAMAKALGDERKRATAIAALPLAIGLLASAAVTAAVDAAIDGYKTVDEARVELDKLKPAAHTPADLLAATTAALAADRTRISEIRVVAQSLRLTGTKSGDVAVTKLIEDGATVAQARERLIAVQAAIEESLGPITSFGGNDRTFDNPEFRRDIFASAFAAKFNSALKVPDAGRPFAYCSILDLATEMLNANGVRVQRGDRENIVMRALHSTSDFPYLLGDVANKLLKPAYDLAVPTYKSIAAERPFNDFKSHKFLTIGDFPDLLKIGENGEVKLGTISEGRELVYMYSWGRRLAINRQMLINDDISAFADMAIMIGRRVPVFENSVVYTMLLQNSRLGPTLADGFNLFDSSNHANYTSSGTAVNLPAELGKLRAKVRAQTSLDGMKLNLSPTVLLVGSDNETAAEQVTTAVTPTQTDKVNKVGPRLTPVVDSNVNGYEFYMLADPAQAPALIYGSLPGQTGPRVMTKEGWSIEGVEIKVMRDFGTGAIDYRPIAKNAGSAPS